MKTYRAKLKSRKRIMAEIPRENQGWWADVCPGQTLTLRDATEADLARCIINEGQSRDPADYLCETFKGGCLVKRIAVETLTEIKNCHSCEHLSYWHGEPGEQNGFMCEKREPKTVGEESKFLRNLDTDAYRNRYKRCFEPGAERKAP